MSLKANRRINSQVKNSFLWKLGKDIVKNRQLYILVLPVVLYYLIFHYKSMYGVIIAFQKYRPSLGIEGSKWVGLDNFARFFRDVYFGDVLGNTFIISGLMILFSLEIYKCNCYSVLIKVKSFCH